MRFGLPDDYWDSYVDEVGDVNVQSVVASARETLTPDRITWIVVGDVATVRPQIEALGLGDLTLLDSDGAIINTP